ncbi:short chain dehydrogenase [Corynebacterium suranareeae]|uniref:Short chain dehydrogenase n=1 Tax=Corynebacterium suranareeae TaxID=2506452 RepID=A0A160PL50_9CORY|nr:SDR family NAD(P)-dependent oxidoreductase [Corynebacterium suranareeae]BAU94359.1 short chain dehydrogenase [Corynebacterium suranareeae]
MSHPLDGKIILVTGAASGMGFEESFLLASQGATVWMTDIAEDKLTHAHQKITEALPEQVGDIHSAVLDVADPESWQSLAEQINKTSSRLDGLVNNAGRTLRASLVETSDEDWLSVMNINLNSVFYGMKYCYPLLSQSENGAVVNVSSTAGLMAHSGPAYGTSKWGVRGLSQSAALEFGGKGIRVNSIHPGLVSSPLLNSGSTEFVEESLKAIPMNRIAEPQEIAEVVSFLLSPQSSYITGTEIVIDGGLNSGGTYKQIVDRINAQLPL